MITIILWIIFVMSSTWTAAYTCVTIWNCSKWRRSYNIRTELGRENVTHILLTYGSWLMIGAFLFGW